ncbi:MAG: glycosyltransferase [Alphaproteobacteria bacterium]|jgi:GT2 family glycosyltransferase|nr:glycosyltransferase [Alphaproteobacteria bacterium]
MNDQEAKRPTADKVRVAIAVATTGRPEILKSMTGFLVAQSVPAELIIVSAAAENDVQGLKRDHPQIEIVFGPKGSSHQRNTALRALKDRCDAVVFFDDDFLPSRFFIERTAALLSAHPEIAGMSGVLKDDGVGRGGVALSEAKALVEAADKALPPLHSPLKTINNMYGCNMVARMPAALDVLFDERLPLYGWQEDVDFSVRLRPYGRIVRTRALTGVHLGVRSGRSPGVPLGYSQIANLHYLVRKGTFTPHNALQLAGRNFAANLAKALFPEPWIDRKGRLVGNLMALRDMAAGRIDPERVRDL